MNVEKKAISLMCDGGVFQREGAGAENALQPSSFGSEGTRRGGLLRRSMKKGVVVALR